VLVYTKVNVVFDQTPVREALDVFADALGVRVVGRFNDDAIGFGIDPTIPIRLEAADQTAIDVLEEILEQCEVYEDCTWQLRKGFIEVSTKERLSVPAARETRTYHIRDLMLEPPQFGSPDQMMAMPSMDKYGKCYLGTPAGVMTKSNRETIRRKAPEDLGLEIVEGIVETIEPGQWDTGVEQGAPLQEAATVNPVPASPSAHPANAASQSGRGLPPAAAQTPRRLTGTGKWATIRLWRDQLIVRAPDFIHRQIDGYPRPIPPESAVVETQAAELSPPGGPAER
jgi:hypothetical protein